MGGNLKLGAGCLSTFSGVLNQELAEQSQGKARLAHLLFLDLFFSFNKGVKTGSDSSKIRLLQLK